MLKLNGHMQDVKDLLGCSDEMAIQVTDEMCINFSECTTRQFNAEARFAYAQIKEAQL
jgi:hypothetical protein